MRASDPTRRRAICGTMRPIKPTIPANTTLLAAKSDDAARMIHCARSMSTPALRARTSPTRSALRAGTLNVAKRTPAHRVRRYRPRSCQSRPAIEPANHATTAPAKSLDCARTIASVTIAANNVDNETPAKISRFESMPLPRRANAATSARSAEAGAETDRRQPRGRDTNQQRDGDCGGRPGADAGEVRIHQRIAQHALQQRTAHRQTGTDDGGDTHARQSQIPHDAIDNAGTGTSGRTNLAATKGRAADQQADCRRAEREQRKAAGRTITSFATRSRTNVRASDILRRTTHVGVAFVA